MALDGYPYGFSASPESSDSEDGDDGDDGKSYDSFYSPSNDYFYSNSPYTKLDHARRKIRLLRVFSRKTVAEHFQSHARWDRKHARELKAEARYLACEIEETALSRVDGAYTTLSYCAGDPKETAVILVNGIPFNAFANLEHAIDHILDIWQLNRPQTDILLWVDQICIDQSNKEERGEQVRFMREIYRRSHETFVCLSTPYVEDCLSWVPRIRQAKIPSRSLCKSSDPPGVVMLRNLLLDFLVGKHRGGDLRPSQQADSSKTIEDSDDVRGSGPLIRSHPEKPAAELTRSADRPQVPAGLMKVLQQASGSTVSQRHDQLLRSFISSSTNTADSVELTSEIFQDSLGHFITNKWWRRSWVYQEFLSANIVHFVSGSQIISWSELLPLVDFISDGLDQFMESIRLYFDSIITEEMKEKEKERRIREKEMERVAAAKRHNKEEKERRERLEQKKEKDRIKLDLHAKKLLQFHEKKDTKMKQLLEDQASVTMKFWNERRRKEEVLEKERDNFTKLLRERRSKKVIALQDARELRIEDIRDRRDRQVHDINKAMESYNDNLALLKTDEESMLAEAEYLKRLDNYQKDMEEFEKERLLEWEEKRRALDQAEKDEKEMERERLDHQLENSSKQPGATRRFNLFQRAVPRRPEKKMTSKSAQRLRTIPSDPNLYVSPTLVRPKRPTAPSRRSRTDIALAMDSDLHGYHTRASTIENYLKRIVELEEKRLRIEEDAERQVVSAKEEMERQMPPEVITSEVELKEKLESIEDYPPLQLIKRRIAELERETAPALQNESDDDEEEEEVVRDSEHRGSRRRRDSMERQDPTSEKVELGAHEIQQKEAIVALQAQFRQVDRSAIESMTKSKKEFGKKEFKSTATDLKALLRHSRNCEASDPRDRVYAFLGLAKRGYDLVPDYSSSNTIKQVLIDTAKSIIRFDNSLAILQHVHHGRDKLGSQLPTWVPDWTSCATNSGFEALTQHQIPPFDAAKDLPVLIDFSENTDYNDPVDLMVYGIRLDSLTDHAGFDEALSFNTEEGNLAAAPQSARSEDEIWILGGCKIPVLLRPETGDLYGYIGEVLLWDPETGVYSDTMFGLGNEQLLQERKVEEIWII